MNECVEHHWDGVGDSRCSRCARKFSHYMEFKNSERAKEEPEWWEEEKKCNSHTH